MQVPTKHIPISFYYMAVEQSKSDVPYSAAETANTLCAVFAMLKTKAATSLIDIRHTMPDKKKVMWLHEYTRLDKQTDTRIDIVFKSAEYDQVREVIDTEEMVKKGKVKQEKDGDEEKTHLSLRLGKNRDLYVAVFEYNHHGVTTIKDIEEYININIEKYLVENSLSVFFKVKFDPYLSRDFLEELKKMKKKNLLSIVVDKKILSQSDFYNISGRGDIKSTITISIGKIGKKQDVPDDLITSMYNDMSPNSKTKRIRVEGTNQAGSLKIDTESMQLKHRVQVHLTQDTHEVNTYDFFQKTHEYVDTLGGI